MIRWRAKDLKTAEHITQAVIDSSIAKPHTKAAARLLQLRLSDAPGAGAVAAPATPGAGPRSLIEDTKTRMNPRGGPKGASGQEGPIQAGAGGTSWINWRSSRGNPAREARTPVQHRRRNKAIRRWAACPQDAAQVRKLLPVRRRDDDADDAARPQVHFGSRDAPPGARHASFLEMLRLRQRCPDEPPRSGRSDVMTDNTKVHT